MTIPDVCKCTGKDCHKKHSCIRYLHPGKEKYQSWVVEILLDKKDCKMYCESYVGITEG